jgi:hypothetical protein
VRGRHHFNGDEIAWIREQLTRLRHAERDEQKRIRGRLRRAGFRISDWATDAQGFTALEFDALLRRGQIAHDDSAGELHPGPDPTDAGVPGGPIDSWVDATLPDALTALAGPRHDVDELTDSVAGARPPGSGLDSPGLYAMYAEPPAWKQLGLGEPPDDRPLYVGKAEDSLVSRDLNTHFASGKTGRSSPRRSFAALLAGQLPLVAMPRRPHNPEPTKWTHYALEPEGDQQLTDWMLTHLRLAVWPCLHPLSLPAIELAVMGEWRPPLNLTGVQQPWKQQVRDARANLTREAMAWPARNPVAR